MTTRRIHDGITERELEVLRLVFIGKSNPEIAHLLGIKVQTVRNHLRYVFNELGAGNRVGAVYAALKRGLLISPGAC